MSRKMILLAGIIEDQAQRDLRGGARRRVLVNVNLAIDASSARVLVHDLSTTGLRMQTETALSIGDVVSIEFPDIPPIDAHIVHGAHGIYGCEFVTPISQAVLSAAVLKSPIVSRDFSGSMTEIPLGADLSQERLAQWFADFQAHNRDTGRTLAGFRNTADGQIIALIAEPD